MIRRLIAHWHHCLADADEGELWLAGCTNTPPATVRTSGVNLDADQGLSVETS